jgi:hypothetical protein
MNYGNKANEMAQPFKRNSQRHSLWRAGKEQWINTQYLNMLQNGIVNIVAELHIR